MNGDEELEEEVIYSTSKNASILLEWTSDFTAAHCLATSSAITAMTTSSSSTCSIL